MSEKGAYCTGWTIQDHDTFTPCRCPECKGYLPGRFPIDKPFRCKKCGVMITPIPGDYEDEEYGYMNGKLCVKPIHLRTPDEIKDQQEYMEKRRQVLAERRAKKKTKTKFLAFIGKDGTTQRVIWTDKKGPFIEVFYSFESYYDSEDRGKIRLPDDRVKRIVDRETFKEISPEKLMEELK